MSGKKQLVTEVTIGADIEVFLKDKNTDEIVSAEGIVKGTKHNPFLFKKGNPFFATSLDNVMAEFCIPPVKSAKDFQMNILEALNYIQSTIPSHLQVFAYPAANINPKYLVTENALLFGCDPDFNAWLGGQVNPAPNAVGSTLRSCGGHIHVGYANSTEEVSMAIIRSMDVFIGLPSILQEPDNERKSLYGKAGAFRFKDYGAEYRTVSNYYLQSPSLTNWAYENTMLAIDFVNAESNFSNEEAEGIQHAINSGDKTLAETLCTYFGVKLAA